MKTWIAWKILSADFSSSHLKSVLSSLPFCWFAQTNQTQRLNCWSLLVIHIHSGLRVFRFYFTKVQYFNCLSRVVDKSLGWLQGEELNWVFFKFWCFAWTLFVFSVFCISCMHVFYRTSPQLVIITNYTILYIINMQLGGLPKKTRFFWDIFPKCGWVGWLIPKQGPNPS